MFDLAINASTSHLGLLTTLFITISSSAALSTFCIYQFIKRNSASLMDSPNHRSMHSQATKTGAGLFIVLIVFVFSLIPMSSNQLGTNTLQISFILLATVSLAVIGWLDDLNKTSIKTRFICFGIISGLACIILGWVSAIPLNSTFALIFPTFLALPLTVITIVWFINLFNFMDGMDGLSGTQTLIGALVFAIWSLHNNDFILLIMNLSLAGATLGFLIWNWSPAKVFMGDVGSLAIGGYFCFSGLYLINMYGVSPIAIILPFACFIFDASYTLLRRAMNGEKILEAHRSHIYQQLAGLQIKHSAIVAVYLCLSIVFALTAIALESAIISSVYAGSITLFGVISLLIWLRHLKTKL